MWHTRLTVYGTVLTAVTLGLLLSLLVWAQVQLPPEDQVMMFTRYGGWILTVFFGTVALFLVCLFVGARSANKQAAARWRQTAQYREAVVILLHETLLEADGLLNRLSPEERREAVCAALTKVRAEVMNGAERQAG